MKDYIFSFGKSNNNSSYFGTTIGNNSVSSYTQSLFNKAMGLTPYYQTPCRSSYDSSTPFYLLPFAVEKKKSPLFDSNYRYKKIQRDLDVYEAWKNAVNRMNAYRNYYGNDSYEALINGIPANFFSDFVQIGDTVIPFNANRSFFNSLTSERKTTILSVSITIIEIFVIE